MKKLLLVNLIAYFLEDAKLEQFRNCRGHGYGPNLTQTWVGTVVWVLAEGDDLGQFQVAGYF